MPESNRRANAALIGLVVAGAALFLFGVVTLWLYQSQHTQEGQTAAQYSAHDTRGEVSATCMQEPRSRTYRCTADIPVADQHDPYAEHDLRAQQDMARWAYAVALISFGTLLMTGAGVWLLWLTLEATRETVTAANKANVTAETTLAETTRIGEAQTRAYLAPSEAFVSLDGNRFSIYAKFLNSGVTPAKSPEFSWQIAVFTGDVANNQYQQAMLNIRSHGHWSGLATMFDAGSNLTIEETLKTAEIPADVLAVLESEVVHIEFSGSLRYGTIFKPGQTTETFNVEFALPSTSLAALRTKGRRMLPRSLDQAFNALREGRYWRGP